MAKARNNQAEAQYDARSEVILSRLREGVLGGWLALRWVRVVEVVAEAYGYGRRRCEFLEGCLVMAVTYYKASASG